MRLRVSAILVAAGWSTRMGSAKQLLPVLGKPMALHSVDALLASGLEEVVVVLNPAHEKVLRTVSARPVRIAINDTPGSDMAGSVLAGLKEISPSATGVLVHLADHPRVLSDTIRRLIEWHEKEPSSILIPCCGSRNGHPALFPRELIHELSTGCTLRDIAERHAHRKRYVAVEDEGVTLDIDTPADYDRLTRSL